ncbi:YwqG family protein [Entamoeba marina]
MSDTNFTDIINSIVGEVISTTTIPAIKLTQVDEKTTVFNSKIGGKPYLPNGFNYPMTHEDEPQPLTLLAQLNFEEFDQLEEFPSTGILQFYINGNSDRVGMDITNFTNSSGFRVIYHKNIITDETLLVDPPNISTYNVPFKKCVKLVGEKS